MVATALRWRWVFLIATLHVILDGGTTVTTWHQAVGPEKWATLSWDSYESVALYVKLLVGVCTTLLTLKDNSWQQAKTASDITQV